MITLYTIGFTKKNAQKFFELLKNAGVRKLVDIRINNASQLAGFAKGTDLKFFMKAICNAEYEHITDLAPTKELLKNYQDKVIDWNGYTVVFKKATAAPQNAVLTVTVTKAEDPGTGVEVKHVLNANDLTTFAAA